MIIMTWKDIMKEEDILRMIDNLQSKAFSYSVDNEEEKTLKEIFATLREMFKNYPEPPKRPVFGGKGRVEGVQFSDE